MCTDRAVNGIIIVPVHVRHTLVHPVDSDGESSERFACL
eukprot:SAG31_NODE_23313_length_506_cov_2.230958_1_plen_38_part_01